MRDSQHFQVSIRASNFEAGYEGITALQTDKLDIEGNIIALIGHNGAGKSTMIKSILGLVPIFRGKIEAYSLQTSPAERLFPERHMAFCPETGAVFADISVESYVKLWCRLKHRDANYYRKSGSRYVDLLNLSPLFPKLGRELSKGQRRRVQTAIGFLCAPKLFLFDEPFDGLDVQKTSELSEIIRTESRDMSFMVSSHRMDVVERLADTIIVLKDGDFISLGSVDQVIKDLCPFSVDIQGLSETSRALDTLQNRFPKRLITPHGNTLRISGEELATTDIKEVLEGSGLNGVQLSPATLSLVDAMNYHLRSYEQVQTN